jgi:hypothetical protein
MIVYQISQMDAYQGCIRHWAKSKADISSIKAKVRAKYRADGNQKDFGGWVGPTKHEIGNGKDGLVRFLNAHCSLDNG